MQTITKFRAYTGAEFDDVDKCRTYEDRCHRIDTELARLPNHILSGCDFANGGGYIQHAAGTFYSVRENLLKIAKETCDHRWIDQALADPSFHASWIHRLTSEGNDSHLDRAWHRILCTDPNLREWGQPFYAAHPDRAKQVQLNP